MEQAPLRVERRGEVIWITIDREARRNAITDAVTLGIAGALERAEAEDARAVVLTGAGSGRSAPAPISRRMRDRSASISRAPARRWCGFCARRATARCR